MCVPVHPGIDVLKGRPSLHVSTQLPWTDCFHHSALSILLRVRLTPEAHEQEPTRIAEDDMFEHDFIVQEDEDERRRYRVARWNEQLSSQYAQTSTERDSRNLGISSALACGHFLPPSHPSNFSPGSCTTEP
jgi:hypothetical protein